MLCRCASLRSNHRNTRPRYRWSDSTRKSYSRFAAAWNAGGLNPLACTWSLAPRREPRWIAWARYSKPRCDGNGAQCDPYLVGVAHRAFSPGWLRLAGLAAVEISPHITA